MTSVLITLFYAWLALQYYFCVTNEEMSHKNCKKNVLNTLRLLSEESWKKMFLITLLLCSDEHGAFLTVSDSQIFLTYFYKRIKLYGY